MLMGFVVFTVCAVVFIFGILVKMYLPLYGSIHAVLQALQQLLVQNWEPNKGCLYDCLLYSKRSQLAACKDGKALPK